MARSEALMVDPQQRLLLEAGLQLQEAAAAAGTYGPAAGAVGTYVGISTPDYADLKKQATPIGVYSATGGRLGCRLASCRAAGLLGCRAACLLAC
jgi:acyl transferase domain-containing protein